MAKTIDDYKKDYEVARARGDAAGMKAANDGANAIRTSQGQAAQVANKDIEYIASQNKPSVSVSSPSTATKAVSSPVSPAKPAANTAAKTSSSPLSPAASAVKIATTPTTSPTSDKTIADYQAAYNAAVLAKNPAAMQVANDGANAIRIALGITPEYASKHIESMAMENNLPMPQSALNKNTEVPPTAPKVQKPVLSGVDLAYSLGNIVDTGGNYIKIHREDGTTVSVQRKLFESNPEKYIGEDGYYSRDNLKTTNQDKYALNAINGMDEYRKLAEGILKPQFDKAVEEQMKQFTSRMLSQGFQGQLPAEEMRAEIMSKLQADYESQVSALAQQLMSQDMDNARWEAEFGLKKDSFALDKELRQQEMDWKREDRPIEKGYLETDLAYKEFQLDEAKKQSKENSEDRLRRIVQEKQDRDWLDYQRDLEKILANYELENKRLDYELRLETDPYAKEKVKLDLELTRANIERTKADIAYIKNNKGQSGSGGGTATEQAPTSEAPVFLADLIQAPDKQEWWSNKGKYLTEKEVEWVLNQYNNYMKYYEIPSEGKDVKDDKWNSLSIGGP